MVQRARLSLAAFSVVVSSLLVSVASAQEPLGVEVDVQTTESGIATEVHVRAHGGQPPYSVAVHVAPPGQEFQSLAVTPGPTPDQQQAALPTALQSLPFAYFVTVDDAAGAKAQKGSRDQPLRRSFQEPPALGTDNVEQALVNPSLETQPADPMALPPAAVETAPSQMQATPPHPVVDGSTPQPAQTTAGKPAQKKVRTEKVVEVCGVPIIGGGARPYFTLGAGLAGLGSLLSAAVAVLFLVDFARALAMVNSLKNAEKKGYAVPEGCDDWKGCRSRYERATYVDGAVVLGSGTTGVVLLVTAVALSLAGAATSRE